MRSTAASGFDYRSRLLDDATPIAAVDQYVGSLSAPDYKLIGNLKYPGIVEDFEHSFATVAALPCNIALAPHPEMVDFWSRVAKYKQGDADALIDPTGCRAYAKDARENFEAQLTKQRASAASAK